MATAAQVLKAALQRILVQGSEAEFEPDEYQDAIFAMNNYMLDLDAKGVTLGYTFVSDLGDDITVPTGALRGVIANVAIEVSPDYNGTVSPALVKAASDGLDTMRLLGQSIPSMRFPSTLPVGSGNEGGRTGLHNQHFYPDLEAEILAETTGCIALEATVLDEDCDPVVPTPFITVSGTLSAFTSDWPDPSAEQSYVVSGGNLTEGIHIAAPIDFEVSLTSGSGFGPTLDLSGDATTVYVRFVRGTSGTSSGDIEHTSAGAGQVDQPVTGTALPIPVITVTSAMIQFSSTAPNPGAEQDYNAAGVDLVADLDIVAPTDFELSLTSGSGFTDTLSISPVLGSVSETVYVRLNRATAGFTGGSITHDSTGAVQKVVIVVGVTS